ncbi:CPBP family intramembrane glutamic endopeptidase [Vogesella oryzae]|uniref:CPBP family intramembrane glutamic endopeptidase n=1 Tax=Vogesella oryzae TaxID=1735285 RepID=UPI001581FD96|nr:CPBP family intramembrane glutamic endopeptidase [Vogesella oryzae]
MPALAPLQLLAFALLATAGLLLLARQRPAACGLLIAALPAALAAGLLTLSALPVLLLAAALLYWQLRQPQRPAPRGLLLLLALLLGLHLLPGFNTVTLWQGRLAADSSPYLLRWGLDKALAGALLLLAFDDWRPALRGQRWPQLASALLLLLLALASALLLGLVRIDVKWPTWWPYWLAGNLLLTCIAEEALFRRTLPQLLPASWPPLVQMSACSLLFGVAHAAGGPVWVMSASLAGLGYALIYRASGQLGWAILAHGALNSLHLALLSYPQLG